MLQKEPGDRFEFRVRQAQFSCIRWGRLVPHLWSRPSDGGVHLHVFKINSICTFSGDYIFHADFDRIWCWTITRLMRLLVKLPKDVRITSVAWDVQIS